MLRRKTIAPHICARCPRHAVHAWLAMRARVACTTCIGDDRNSCNRGLTFRPGHAGMPATRSGNSREEGRVALAGSGAFRVPRAQSIAFTEFRSAGAVLHLSPRGDRSPRPFFFHSVSAPCGGMGPCHLLGATSVRHRKLLQRLVRPASGGGDHQPRPAAPLSARNAGPAPPGRGDRAPRDEKMCGFPVGMLGDVYVAGGGLLPERAIAASEHSFDDFAARIAWQFRDQFHHLGAFIAGHSAVQPQP